MMLPPETNPVTVVLAKILRMQQAAPFQPFVIVTSSGKSYKIPSADHVTVMRLSRRIAIENDDYSGADVNPLHVTAVELLAPPVA
jgi:hypothetical protein